MKSVRTLEVERRRRGETQAELATAVADSNLRVTQGTISLLERGLDMAYGPQILKRIARHFGFPEAIAPRLLERAASTFSDNPNDPGPPRDLTLEVAAKHYREIEAKEAKTKAAKAKRKGGRR